MRDKELKSVTT